MTLILFLSSLLEDFPHHAPHSTLDWFINKTRFFSWLPQIVFHCFCAVPHGAFFFFISLSLSSSMHSINAFFVLFNDVIKWSEKKNSKHSWWSTSLRRQNDSRSCACSVLLSADRAEWRETTTSDKTIREEIILCELLNEAKLDVFEVGASAHSEKKKPHSRASKPSFSGDDDQTLDEMRWSFTKWQSESGAVGNLKLVGKIWI